MIEHIYIKGIVIMHKVFQLSRKVASSSGYDAINYSSG